MSDIDRPEISAARPWGIWATIGWVLLAMVISTGVAAAALAVWHPDAFNLSDVEKYGDLLSFTLIVSVPIQIIVLALAARLARWPAAEYLGFVRPSRQDLVVGVASIVAFVAAFDGLSYLLGQDVVTPFQVDSYRSAREAGALPMFWFAVVIVAPLGEEIVFRGFVYRGWVKSRRHVVPAILIISLLWSLLHIQYNWFGILQVFCSGLLLGWVRWRSGSTMLTSLLHGIVNLWATLETMAKLQWFS